MKDLIIHGFSLTDMVIKSGTLDRRTYKGKAAKRSELTYTVLVSILFYLIVLFKYHLHSTGTVSLYSNNMKWVLSTHLLFPRVFKIDMVSPY